MKKPTLEAVAAAAGVSKMTASRALRGTSDVSAASTHKVSEAARQLGYVPNRLALSLSSSRTNLVSVVVPSMTNIVFPEMLSGIRDGFEGTDMQAVFGITDYEPDKEYEVIRSMLSWQPAAIIVTGLDQSEETRKLLKCAELPVIQIMDTDGDPVEFNIGFSHRQAGIDMATAIIKTGRKRIGYIGSALRCDQRAIRRRDGFRQILQSHGLDFIGEATADGFSSSTLGKQLTLELLTRHRDLDCIYYTNDDMAAGGLFAAMQLGISVPQQLLIAGFNGLEITGALPAQIATTRSPRREMGELAAIIARRALTDERPLLDRIITFTPEIIMGDAGLVSNAL